MAREKAAQLFFASDGAGLRRTESYLPAVAAREASVAHPVDAMGWPMYRFHFFFVFLFFSSMFSLFFFYSFLFSFLITLHDFQKHLFLIIFSFLKCSKSKIVHIKIVHIKIVQIKKMFRYWKCWNFKKYSFQKIV